MERQEWLELVRGAFGLDQGVGQEEDYDHVVRLWQEYGQDWHHDCQEVAQALAWVRRSGRFSGVLEHWLRQHRGEALAELFAELLAGYDRSCALQGVYRWCCEHWGPRARVA